MTRAREITKEEEDWIRDNLRYDPDTGYIWWTKRNYGRIFEKPAGNLHKYSGYITVGRNIKGVIISYKAHRLAWFLYYKVWPKDQVDHINGVKDDNRIFNLREATNSENQGNRKIQVGHSSKYKGVYWNKQGNKWRAKIKVKNKYIEVGSYFLEEEAALAYNKAALEHFGEYAKINDVTP